MAFEPTTAGNEFQLTKNQHFHMSAILRKFIGDDNKVAVTYKESGKQDRFSVQNRLFVAKRAWSQELEKYISWPIEQAFIQEVGRIEAGSPVEEHEAISTYHLLWSLRHFFAMNPSDARTLFEGLTGRMDRRLEEYVESIGKLPLNRGVIASRFATGLDIKHLITLPENLAQYKGIFWQVLRSEEARFISADSYPNKLLMPIGPHILLKGCQELEEPLTVDSTHVEMFNRLAHEEATTFTFG